MVTRSINENPSIEIFETLLLLISLRWGKIQLVITFTSPFWKEKWTVFRFFPGLVTKFSHDIKLPITYFEIGFDQLNHADFWLFLVAEALLTRILLTLHKFSAGLRFSRIFTQFSIWNFFISKSSQLNRFSHKEFHWPLINSTTASRFAIKLN